MRKLSQYKNSSGDQWLKNLIHHAHGEVSLLEKVVIRFSAVSDSSDIICLKGMKKNTFIACQFIQCDDSQFV